MLSAGQFQGTSPEESVLKIPCENFCAQHGEATLRGPFRLITI
jgi:hypothetical protein